MVHHEEGGGGDGVSARGPSTNVLFIKGVHYLLDTGEMSIGMFDIKTLRLSNVKYLDKERNKHFSSRPRRRCTRK